MSDSPEWREKSNGSAVTSSRSWVGSRCFCSRLEFIEPPMRSLGEQLVVAVSQLIAGVGAPDEEFKTRRDKVRRAFLAMDRKRNELADEESLRGRRTKRSQQGENGPGELARE